MANRDGSNVVKVTSKARSFTPAWAPDGRRLVYIYDPCPGEVDAGTPVYASNM